MSPLSRHDQALRDAAAKLSGIARSTLLDGACFGDPSLRERVEALLAANEQPETLMAKKVEMVCPTLKPDLADAPDEAVGQTLGRYKFGWRSFSLPWLVT